MRPSYCIKLISVDEVIRQFRAGDIGHGDRAVLCDCIEQHCAQRCASCAAPYEDRMLCCLIKKEFAVGPLHYQLVSLFAGEHECAHLAAGDKIKGEFDVVCE